MGVKTVPPPSFLPVVSSPASGEVLTYNGSNWVNDSVSVAAPIVFRKQGSTDTTVTFNTKHWCDLGLSQGENAAEGNVDDKTFLGVAGAVAKFWVYVSGAATGGTSTIRLRHNGATVAGCEITIPDGTPGWYEASAPTGSLSEDVSCELEIDTTGTTGGATTIEAVGLLLTSPT